MIRCKDCKHFVPENDNFIERYHGEEYAGYTGMCGLSCGARGVPSNVGTLAFAADADWGYASLMVKPDYGCVQGEARE